MIVFYDEKGEIEGSITGSYDKSRHNFDEQNYIEVEKQNLSEKKVDIENQKLVNKLNE